MIAETSMLLPGNQPEIAYRWSTDDADLNSDAVTGDSSPSFSLPLGSDNLDPYTDYNVNVVIKDEENHSFFI